MSLLSAFSWMRSFPMRALKWALRQPKRITTNVCILSWAAWQLFATNILQNLLQSKYHIARCVAWPKLSRRCGVAYPKPLAVAQSSDLLKYAMRHAMSAYPPSMLVALGELPVTFFFTTTARVLKYCFDINHEDIVDFEKGQTTNQPSFYLCVDHTEKRIVVSVRGTVPSNVCDVLTDLDAKPMSYSGGEVHQGMSLSAKYVLDAIRKEKKARDLLFKWTDYEVLFCGHSLGAGVAALMAMRVLNGEASVFAEYATKEKIQTKKIQAFAFASPGVASWPLIDPDQEWNQIVTSVALSTDLVTRLSVRSYLTHVERCECISKWTEEELSQAMIEGDERGDWLIDSLNKTGEPDGQMFPLGRVLWYVPDVRQSDHEHQRGHNFEVVGDCPKNKDLHINGFLNTLLVYLHPLVHFCTDLMSFCSELMSFCIEKVLVSISAFLLRCFGHDIDLLMYCCAFADLAKNVFAKALRTRLVKMMLWVLNFFGLAFDLDLSASTLKYKAPRYQLCDATQFKEQIFQNLILDIESLHAHFPNRYLWACGVALKQ